MKVTKYPQSCLIIEQGGKRLVIDPGSLVAARYQVQDLLPLNAVLITHEHQDHADPELLHSLAQNGKVPLYANTSVKRLLGDVVTTIVNDGDTFEVAGFQVTARELPHCLMPDGSAGPQNTGFVINEVFFDAGDGIKLDGLKVDSAAIPIAGPDISPKDVFDFIKQLGCHTVIPIHYDFFLENPKLFPMFGQGIVPDVKFVVLENGQSTEV